jgi:hypothetical protein
MATGSFLRAALLSSFAVLAAGCSSGGGLSTGSLFGGNAEAKATATALPDNNTPAGRALHVGTVAARATKCGYNFDAGALRANYLASEAAAGTAVVDLAKLEKIYDTGYRGVISAAASDPGYCNAARTESIKPALNKLLAGDYSPPAPVAEADGGLFGGFFDQDVVADKGTPFGSEGWWDKQRDKGL